MFEHNQNAPLEHFFMMLSINYPHISSESIKEHIELYRNIEGENDWKDLLKSLNEVDNQQQWPAIQEIINEYASHKLTLDRVTEIGQEILQTDSHVKQ